MNLLLASKKIWTYSYWFMFFFLAFLLWKSLNSPFSKTLLIINSVAQLLVTFFYYLIVNYSMRKNIRFFASLAYILIIIYLWSNQYISKWYVIIPFAFLTYLYLLWYVGGIINCFIASEYEKELRKYLEKAKSFYNQYENNVFEFNERNHLGFFTKVRIQTEPEWDTFDFEFLATDMFSPLDGIFGIETKQWDKAIDMLNSISSDLFDFNYALTSDTKAHIEKNMFQNTLNNISVLSESDTKHGLKQLEKNIKDKRKIIKKILKRRIFRKYEQ